jgi:hypothetical protein
VADTPAVASDRLRLVAVVKATDVIVEVPAAKVTSP